MIDRDQFIREIIEPATKELGVNSPSATNLLLGTAMAESQLRYLKQLGNGPACGVMQMEPTTHDDIDRNWLRYRPYYRCILKPIDSERLIYDLRYAVMMARCHYLRDPHPLPAQDDIVGLACTWKRVYNTWRGAGTVEHFVESLERIGIR